jgi:hypothetical protein
MSATKNPVRYTHDLVTAPDEPSWTHHRDHLLRVPDANRWRGCMGIALVVTRPESGVCCLGRLFVPDRDVRWISLMDLPRGAFQLGVTRRVQWAAVYPTHIRYGMPTLGGKPEFAFDLRWGHAGDRPANSNLDRLRGVSTIAPQLIPVVDALNSAMTKSVLTGRAAWRSQRLGCFGKVVGRGPRPNHLPPPGPGTENENADTAIWMPRAYLAFADTYRDRLFAWATPRGGAGSRPFYPPDLRRRLCADAGRDMPVYAPAAGAFVGAKRASYHGLPVLNLAFKARNKLMVVRVTRQARIHVSPGVVVGEGDLVANDRSESMPSWWHRLPLAVRWNHVLPTTVGRKQVDAWVRLWFDRQHLTIQPGLVHAPADLAAVAAMGQSVDTELYWDLGPAMDHYHEVLDAFVFPPILMRAWWKFRGVLPGEVAFDFTPRHSQFVRRPDRVNYRTTPRRKI